MSSVGLLEELEQAGVRLWLDGEEIRYRVLRSEITDDLRAFLKRHKAALKTLLQADKEDAPVEDTCQHISRLPGPEASRKQKSYLLRLERRGPIAVNATAQRRWGVPIAGFGGPMNELFGPHCSDYHLVLKRIKAALDPNSSCDSWAYTGPSEKALPEEKGTFSMY